MNKNIIIIGGGISGLSVLHFLKKKYANRPDVRIRLLEKNANPGGTIQTLIDDGSLFECGPNGFLANQPATLGLIEDLGLSADIISASKLFQKRFVIVDGELHAFPKSLGALFKFKPMTFMHKLRIFLEPFIAKGNNPQETVYDFAKRRFGVKAARCFVDPMVSGVYAGDSEFLNMQATFPKIYELEQRFGSVIGGMVRSRPKMKSELKSLRLGMGQLTGAISRKYRDEVQPSEGVTQILQADQSFVVVTQHEKYVADVLVMATPAHHAGGLLKTIHADLGQALESIEYAPLAVIGLVYDRAAFKNLINGFGYLVPSSEESSVLGVLIESNVFEGRSQPDKVLLRVMIGGSRYPEYVKKSREELFALARHEVEQRFGGVVPPIGHFFISYPKAIPQYETQYPILKQRIETALIAFPRLHLVSNYWGGVAMNDCVSNAKEAVGRIEI